MADSFLERFNELERRNCLLFKDLRSESIEKRKSVLNDIKSKIHLLVYPPSSWDDNMNAKSLTKYYSLILLRLKTQCPFADVVESCDELLGFIANSGAEIPSVTNECPSWFIPKDSFDKLEKFDSSLKISEFLSSGRYPNYMSILSIFKEFSTTFSQSLHTLFQGRGPLPISWRLYIAIIAAAQHDCQYLVSLYKFQFLTFGGNIAWLQGISHAPKKLQDLNKTNALLAHQPWRLTKTEIEFLVRGEADNWSHSELIHAFLILATAHSLSSFIMGSGVVYEPDLCGGNTFFPISNTNHLYNLNEDPRSFLEDTNNLLHILKNQEKLEPENKTFFDKRKSSLEFHSAESPKVAKDNSSNCELLFDKFEKFKGEETIEHSDFDVKSTEYSIFHLNDFSWEDHGCSEIARYLPEIAELLDNEFRDVLNITDSILADNFQEKVDTLPFREAIWNYVLRVSGLFQDDYNYHKVNVLLNRGAKSYIKKIACLPKFLNPSDFFNMGLHFRDSEKFHMNILASEARKQAEILHALRAMNDYINSN